MDAALPSRFFRAERANARLALYAGERLRTELVLAMVARLCAWRSMSGDGVLTTALMNSCLYVVVS